MFSTLNRTPYKAEEPKESVEEFSVEGYRDEEEAKLPLKYDRDNCILIEEDDTPDDVEVVSVKSISKITKFEDDSPFSKMFRNNGKNSINRDLEFSDF